MTLPDGDPLELLDWKRRIFETYAEVRSAVDPGTAWTRWREVRDGLFATHPQSPIPEGERAGFRGLSYYGHDPAARVAAEVARAELQHLEIAGSAGQAFGATRFAIASFELAGQACTLDLFWLEGYGGGLFVPFRDATAGGETYGAGRYLLDTVKGADLGVESGRLVFDFNFAYNPSCAYDPRWACPLAPLGNRLGVPVRAGERLAS